MPIKKFRSVEEMEGPPKLNALDPENLRIACELTEFARALHPWVFEPGVKKFRSQEEAFVARKEWESAQIRKGHRTK